HRPGRGVRRGGGQRSGLPGRDQPGHRQGRHGGWALDGRRAVVTRPMTITEKILARAAGRTEVVPGDLIMAEVDLAMGNDITAPVAIKRFRELDVGRVWDRSKIALVPSHFVPAKDIASANLMTAMRAFAREQDIEHYFELGRGGIEH